MLGLLARGRTNPGYHARCSRDIGGFSVPQSAPMLFNNSSWGAGLRCYMCGVWCAPRRPKVERRLSSDTMVGQRSPLFCLLVPQANEMPKLETWENRKVEPVSKTRQRGSRYNLKVSSVSRTIAPSNRIFTAEVSSDLVRTLIFVPLIFKFPGNSM